jgi:hypothetical protein
MAWCALADIFIHGPVTHFPVRVPCVPLEARELGLLFSRLLRNYSGKYPARKRMNDFGYGRIDRNYYRGGIVNVGRATPYSQQEAREQTAQSWILNAAPTPTQRVGCDEDNLQAGSIASATTSATSLLQEFSFIRSFQTIFCPI